MRDFLRHAVCFGLAVTMTAWILYRAPAPAALAAPANGPLAVKVSAPPVDISTMAQALDAEPLETGSDATKENAAEADEAEPQPDSPPPETSAAEATPDDEPAEKEPESVPPELPESEAEAGAAPPPELGASDGADEGTTTEEDEEDAPVVTPLEDFVGDRALLAEARRELEGAVKRGFKTVFISGPEDQLEIARAFGEEVVLVPRSALDEDAKGTRSFRLDLRPKRPRVIEIDGRPPLERFRQYRDLFAYDFARLPKAIRDLRTTVVRRDQVYLFAALIPASEWAIVVGRRREATAQHGIEETDVSRFVMRYVRRNDGRFDIAVESFVLSDGRTIYNNSPSHVRARRAPTR